MNYSQSKQILQEIKKAKRILTNIHRSSDPDSVASALSLKAIIETIFKKEVTVIAVDNSYQGYKYISGTECVRVIEPLEFNFSEYDLFIIVDCEMLQQAGISADNVSDITVINIDHHPKNNIRGKHNLLDKAASSTSEIVYLLNKDWRVNINKELATTLLAGIMGDTGIFTYVNTKPRTLSISSELIESGADHPYVVYKMTQFNSLNLLKLWGSMLDKLEVDTKYNFAWSALPFEVYSKYNSAISPSKSFSNLIIRTVEGTNFGISMVEKEKKVLHISIRSRVEDFDISPIARELGGGGHKAASGASVAGLPFEKAVAKVLRTARKFAK